MKTFFIIFSILSAFLVHYSAAQDSDAFLGVADPTLPDGVIGGTAPIKLNVANSDASDGGIVFSDNAGADDSISAATAKSVAEINIIDNAVGDSMSPSKTPETSASFINVCLQYHNIERAEVGVPKLTWSSTLAKQAETWSQHMASTQSFVHSHTAHTGENIAECTSTDDTLFRLFRTWVNEKQHFIYGCKMPDCSTTSAEVGHYTAMVWSTTTEVGCGWAKGPSYNYLTCQYLPSGNVLGSKVY